MMKLTVAQTEQQKNECSGGAGQLVVRDHCGSMIAT